MNLNPILLDLLHIPPKIMEKIETHLAPNDFEKEKFGEVFTPVSLILEMLALVPPHIWKNKDLKWLDPANGIGNFMIVVYYKLLATLTPQFETQSECSAHIIKNMLYMNEINSKNVEITKELFKMIDSNARTSNIYKSDFLKGSNVMMNKTKTKYDIIIGNPPYNAEGIRSNARKKTGNEKSIYKDFIEKSIALLNPHGLLLFLTPNSWVRNPDFVLYKTPMHYYKNIVINDAFRIFGRKSAQISLCYFLVEKTEKTMIPKIYDKCTNNWIAYDIQKNGYIPFDAIGIQKKLMDLSKKWGSLSKYLKKYYKKEKIPIIDSISGKYPISQINNKKIQAIQYSSNYDCSIDGEKIILSGTSYGYPLHDKYGILQNNAYRGFVFMGMDSSADLKLLQSFLISPFVMYMYSITRTHQKYIDERVFSILPDITNIPGFRISAMYKLFGFTKGEIQCIENAYAKSKELQLTAHEKKDIIKYNISKNIKLSKIKSIRKNINRICKNKTRKN
jgi:hypothetical protein